MTIRLLPFNALIINRANDRHGELENETAAIAWLFNNREPHMRNLTKDLVRTGEIFEPPLVSPQDDKFIVFDGNRRVLASSYWMNTTGSDNGVAELLSRTASRLAPDIPETIHCQ